MGRFGRANPASRPQGHTAHVHTHTNRHTHTHTLTLTLILTPTTTLLAHARSGPRGCRVTGSFPRHALFLSLYIFPKGSILVELVVVDERTLRPTHTLSHSRLPTHSRGSSSPRATHKHFSDPADRTTLGRHRVKTPSSHVTPSSPPYLPRPSSRETPDFGPPEDESVELDDNTECSAYHPQRPSWPPSSSSPPLLLRSRPRDVTQTTAR